MRCLQSAATALPHGIDVLSRGPRRFVPTAPLRLLCGTRSARTFPNRQNYLVRRSDIQCFKSCVSFDDFVAWMIGWRKRFPHRRACTWRTVFAYLGAAPLPSLPWRSRCFSLSHTHTHLGVSLSSLSEGEGSDDDEGAASSASSSSFGCFCCRGDGGGGEEEERERGGGQFCPVPLGEGGRRTVWRRELRRVEAAVLPLASTFSRGE